MTTHVGINGSEDLESSLTAFPSPTKDILNIGFTTEERSSFSVEVRNVFGQIVFAENMGNYFRLTLSK